MSLLHGDCLDVMAAMEPKSVDAIVTDPPYGLEFMGKEWDKLWDKRGGIGRGAKNFSGRDGATRKEGFGNLGPSAYQAGAAAQAFHAGWAEAAYRVAKPSAYLLAFGGTRTVHRMTVALEDAGWIIRDMLVWAYASGFPKSKASLKPAWEPIVMARKPGPLRMLAIDECRIGTTKDVPASPSQMEDVRTHGKFGPTPTDTEGWNAESGRWPANVILTDEIFDGGWEGVVGGGEASRAGDPTDVRGFGGIWHEGNGVPAGPQYGDSGTYSRFFMLGPTSTPSGIMGTCQTCGAPIAESSSTTATQPADTAPPPTDTMQSAQLDLAAFDAANRSPSPATATAPSPVATLPAGTPAPTETEAPLPGKSGMPRSTDGTSPSTSLEPPPATESPSDQPARTAAQPPTSTGTTTTTAALSMCERCADDVMHGRTLPQRKPTRPALSVDGDDYTRFLIIPKADRTDREPVLGGLSGAPLGELRTMSDGANGHDPDRPITRRNQHPTVKPVDLMRHLVRLVTPAGGTVLDPFLGSGTTALAAEREGFPWIGIEREAEYVAIAEARLNGTQKGLGLVG